MPAPRWLTKLRTLIGAGLLTVGVTLVAAGVIYWWNGWRAGVGVLLLTLMIGLLFCGLGLLLMWPSSPGARKAAVVCLAGSGLAFVVIWLTDSAMVACISAAIVGGGGVWSYLRATKG